MSESRNNTTYKSIFDLPIFNWERLLEGKTEYLYHEPEGKEPKGKESLRLKVLWDKIYEDYFQKYVINSESFKESIRQKRELAEMRVDSLVNGNKRVNTFIKIAELELEENDSEPMDLFQRVVTLEKFLGFAIDVHKCSVAKYHSYIDQFKKLKK